MSLPLEGLLVADFSQFLSGPSATLRLQDLGARVVKVEQADTGDITRSIYANHLNIGDNSAFFEAINRGKESIVLNLKNDTDKTIAKSIVAKADILVHNFRPGVMKRLGFSYEDVQSINADIIYGEISGYGCEGPWTTKPGQDLLLQALSGLTYMTGGEKDGPVAMGVAIADNLAGAHLVQGILASLVAGGGAHVEVSMLESILDFQFEPLTLYYQDGLPIQRGNQNPAHPLVAAPYGLYKTKDGYLALAMGSIPQLGELLGCSELDAFDDPSVWFARRDDIKAILATHLQTDSTSHWLSILEPADIWCAEVLNWTQLLAHDGFKILDMLQTLQSTDGRTTVETLRCPIRLDERILKGHGTAPKLGANTQDIIREFHDTRE